jgi:tetratricopeptide (TPR) repeat protein
MKISRYLTSGLALTLLTGILFLSSGCNFVNTLRGKDKLNQGILKYNQGHTNEAATMFEEASTLIPSNPNVWLCLGAVKYKKIANAGPGEVVPLSKEALECYTKALDNSNPNDCKIRDTAIGYIATINGDRLENENARREWLLKRTEGECATTDIKAVTYYSIGVQYWQCATGLSNAYQDKQKVDTDPFHYRVINNPVDKTKFDDCMNKGFEYLNKSIAAKPDYSEAYSYLSLMLREKQKTNSGAEAKKFEAEAQKEAKMAIELAAKAKAAAEAKAAEEAAKGEVKK